MGLCKCPRKKVTNQFCFEHRVNVCEHCMISNHPKCIVQSYLQWLQDSDYNPICELCKNQLAVGECTRLCCYHVFHWQCLDSYAREFPSSTAPAGYTCPICKTCIFPLQNDGSPVAENVRKALSAADWARAGCGLPLINTTTTSVEMMPAISSSGVETVKVGQSLSSSGGETGQSISKQWPSPPHESQSIHIPSRVDVSQSQYQRSTDSFSNVMTGPSSPRRLYDATEADSMKHVSIDHDENKYKRRSAIEWFARWFKSHSSTKGRHDPHRRFKRYVVIAVLLVIGFFTMVMIFMRLGRASADDDPFLDPLANPNIRIKNNDGDDT